MNYRPDIDGLRAIAILFVLFFHGGLKLFPSGFIGVDIFFVISGFLITGIINDSLQKNTFSFLEFYNRRLWRLQPVFICLIIITSLLTLLFFLPADLLQYSKSARKSSIFIANTFFEKITTDYFASDNTQLPLLHTWSLSIEWQCYLILPIAIYCLHKIFGRGRVTQIIYLLTLLFFALSLYSSLNYPGKTYYQTLSRIFEFLIGSCVALNQSRFSFNKYFLNAINLLAILALFYIATRSNISLGYPNGYALILCIATAILIASGQQSPRPIMTQVLAVKPLVFIGLISYSLYIWHWPLFVLIRYLGIEESTSILLWEFSLAFILAYLSWRFIEKPTRQFKNIKWGYTLILMLLVPVVFIHLSDYVIKHHEGFPNRFAEIARIDTQLKQYANPQRPLCLEEKNIAVNQNCVLGAPKTNNKTGFMIGDSYSNHFWGFIDTLGKEANVSILAHATSACLALPGISLNDWNAKLYTACQKQTSRYFNMIKTNHYDFVIIGQNWNGYLNKLNLPLNHDGSNKLAQQRIEKALDNAIQMIIAVGSKPVLLKSIALTGNPHDCFFQHIKRRKPYKPEQCNFEIKPEDQQWQNALFSRMKHKYAQLIIIDPQKVQCIKGLCKADINGLPIFRDAGHINDYAAYQLANNYLRRYDNPLGKTI